MRLIYLFTLLVTIALSSCNGPKSNERKIVVGDTIRTASGLQYYYEKIGKGRKVEAGCEMATYLSLKVGDSVVWTSADQPDSLFTYVAGYTRLIKGFTEISMLLREGDEVIAILPDSLAYGAEGAGDIIPPHATLVYDKFKVVRVDEPKGIMADTLLKAIGIGGEKAVMEKFKEIATTADSNKYHIGQDHLYRLWDMLSKTDQHMKAAEVAACFADVTNDNKLWYKMVLSLEKLGELKEAKDNLEVLIGKEPTNKEFTDKLFELNARPSVK
ncbi:FKBP-type peptidyl-prolyl cis-trans isomerase [Ancylomarina sp. YFZ004]